MESKRFCFILHYNLNINYQPKPSAVVVVGPVVAAESCREDEASAAVVPDLESDESSFFALLVAETVLVVLPGRLKFVL
jgi:hypothetical protein